MRRKEKKKMKLELGEDPTFEDIVEFLMAYRVARDEAQFDLMKALLYVETNHLDKITEWGHESFDSFVKANNFCRPDVYRDFTNGLGAIGGDIDVADAIGYEGVRSAAHVPADGRDGYIELLLQQVKEDKGKRPSRGAARYAAVKYGAPVESKSLGRAAEVKRLREENKALRAEVDKLRKENAKLRKKALEPA